MGDGKKLKKKCCGKFKKKGKHCSSCPMSRSNKKCKQDKDYCESCEVRAKGKKKEKKGKKKKQKKKK
jgi:hypothetical protein